MSAHSDTRLDFLLRHAAGHLDPAFSLLAGVHIAMSDDARRLYSHLEELGGALLDDIEPAEVEPDEMNRALRAMDRREFDPRASSAAAPKRPKMPDGVALPSPLADVDIGDWRWIAPGVRSARVALPKGSPSRAFLLEIAPGVKAPRHGHEGVEGTCVLRGGFRDGEAHYVRGAIAIVDETVEHDIVIDSTEPCLCLIAMEGRTRPIGWLGRLYQKFSDI